MISDAVEIAELRETTADLIADNPTTIALQRVVWQRTPSGGMSQTGNLSQPPKQRYFGAVRGDPTYVTREQGEVILARHVLVGLPGDDIQEKDTFSVGSRKFEVVEIHPDATWQTKAWVTEKS